MKKMKRSTVDYGGGTGHIVYNSDMFRVVVWQLLHGVKTTLKCKLLSTELDFHGDQQNQLISDEACMYQYNYSEIIEMMDAQKNIGYTNGANDKIKEFRELMQID